MRQANQILKASRKAQEIAVKLSQMVSNSIGSPEYKMALPEAEAFLEIEKELSLIDNHLNELHRIASTAHDKANS